MPSPKEKRPLPTFLPVDDAVRLMEMPDTSTPEGVRDKAIFELLYGSGLRVSELTGLNYADLDMGERLIRVRGKGRKERIVPITKKAAKAVAGHLAHMEITPLEDSPLFINKREREFPRPSCAPSSARMKKKAVSAIISPLMLFAIRRRRIYLRARRPT